MELTDLNDDCLTALFRNCPLHTLMRLRQVCTRFHLLIHRLCHLKRSLKLFGNSTFRLAFNRIFFKKIAFCLHQAEDREFANVTQNDDDLVIYSEEKFLVNNTIAFLVEKLFPNVEVLFWCGFTSPMVDCLVAVVGKWPLHSLFIQGQLRTPSGGDQLHRQVCDAINSLNLRRLDFRLTDFCLKNIHHNLLFQLEPTLCNLEQFALKHWNCEGELLPLLGKLGANCTHLSLEYEQMIKHSNEFLDSFIEECPQLISGLTHLRFRVFQLACLPLICDHFTNLEHLDLRVNGVEYFKFNANLMENLLKLPKLSELRLAEVLHNKSDDNKFDFFVQPIFTVKSVFLSLQARPMQVKINFDYDFLFEMLKLIFPNLELLDLYVNSKELPDLRDKLRQFEKLRTCYMNVENYRFL